MESFRVLKSILLFWVISFERKQKQEDVGFKDRVSSSAEGENDREYKDCEYIIYNFQFLNIVLCKQVFVFIN